MLKLTLVAFKRLEPKGFAYLGLREHISKNRSPLPPLIHLFLHVLYNDSAAIDAFGHSSITRAQKSPDSF